MPGPLGNANIAGSQPPAGVNLQIFQGLKKTGDSSIKIIFTDGKATGVEKRGFFSRAIHWIGSRLGVESSVKEDQEVISQLKNALLCDGEFKALGEDSIDALVDRPLQGKTISSRMVHEILDKAGQELAGMSAPHSQVRGQNVAAVRILKAMNDANISDPWLRNWLYDVQSTRLSWVQRNDQGSEIGFKAIADHVMDDFKGFMAMFQKLDISFDEHAEKIFTDSRPAGREFVPPSTLLETLLADKLHIRERPAPDTAGLRRDVAPRDYVASAMDEDMAVILERFVNMDIRQTFDASMPSDFSKKFPIGKPLEAYFQRTLRGIPPEKRDVAKVKAYTSLLNIVHEIDTKPELLENRNVHSQALIFALAHPEGAILTLDGLTKLLDKHFPRTDKPKYPEGVETLEVFAPRLAAALKKAFAADKQAKIDEARAAEARLQETMVRRRLEKEQGRAFYDVGSETMSKTAAPDTSVSDEHGKAVSRESVLAPPQPASEAGVQTDMRAPEGGYYAFATEAALSAHIGDTLTVRYNTLLDSGMRDATRDIILEQVRAHPDLPWEDTVEPLLERVDFAAGFLRDSFKNFPPLKRQNAQGLTWEMLLRHSKFPPEASALRALTEKFEIVLGSSLPDRDKSQLIYASADEKMTSDDVRSAINKHIAEHLEYLFNDVECYTLLVQMHVKDHFGDRLPSDIQRNLANILAKQARHLPSGDASTGLRRMDKAIMTAVDSALDSLDRHFEQLPRQSDVAGLRTMTLSCLLNSMTLEARCAADTSAEEGNLMMPLLGDAFRLSALGREIADHAAVLYPLPSGTLKYPEEIVSLLLRGIYLGATLEDTRQVYNERIEEYHAGKIKECDEKNKALFVQYADHAIATAFNEIEPGLNTPENRSELYLRLSEFKDGFSSRENIMTEAHLLTRATGLASVLGIEQSPRLAGFRSRYPEATRSLTGFAEKAQLSLEAAISYARTFEVLLPEVVRKPSLFGNTHNNAIFSTRIGQKTDMPRQLQQAHEEFRSQLYVFSQMVGEVVHSEGGHGGRISSRERAPQLLKMVILHLKSLSKAESLLGTQAKAFLKNLNFNLTKYGATTEAILNDASDAEERAGKSSAFIQLQGTCLLYLTLAMKN